MDTGAPPRFEQAMGIVRWAWAIVPLGMIAACAGPTSSKLIQQQRSPDVQTAFLEQYAATYRFRLGRPTSITVTPDDAAVLFLRSGPRSFTSDLYSFDPKTGEETVLLTAEALLDGHAEHLSEEEKARRERMRLALRGIASYRLSTDGKRLIVPLSGKIYIVDRMSRAVEAVIDHPAGPAVDPQLSPTQDAIACVRDGDLYVHELAGKTAVALTRRESPTITYGLAEFVAQEEMSRLHGFWWAPDGKSLLYQRTDESDVEVLHIGDPSDPTKTPYSAPYPRPGRNNAKVTLGIIGVEGGDTTWIEWDREAYPYVASVRWPKAGRLTLAVQDRRQRELQLLAVDPATGATSPLLRETDAAWVNLDQDVPRWLADGSGFLWTTERDGAKALELRAADGSAQHTIVPNELGYRSLVHVDEDAEQVVVRASPTPVESQLYRVPLAGGAPVKLSEGLGEHHAAFGDGDLWVHLHDPAAAPLTWTVRDAAGDALGKLRSVSEAPPQRPRYELTTVDVDGRTHHAVIIRPRHVEPGSRFPVLVHVYGGPWVQMVTATQQRYHLDQWFADQGFIVVSIDARGTPGRGRDWERSVRGNLIEAPLDDQAKALQALGAEHPELDLGRVGIFGWSFGGYFSSMAVMRRPDVFHAGIAGAPVADWLDYDTHYTERYMGLPEENLGGYTDASVLTHAPKLTRPLLIIHGTADDNVYITHSIKISDALFRAGRPHEFLPLSGLTHMVPEPAVAVRLQLRMLDFFRTHLK